MTQPSPKSQKPLTERQRLWREHLLAAERAGVRLSDYAEREGLSVQAMYAARVIGHAILPIPGQRNFPTLQ